VAPEAIFAFFIDSVAVIAEANLLSLLERVLVPSFTVSLGDSAKVVVAHFPQVA
jgi:hypothetical protein